METDSTSQIEPPHKAANPRLEFCNSEQIKTSQIEKRIRHSQFKIICLFRIWRLEFGVLLSAYVV